jgi:hypothetical protein
MELGHIAETAKYIYSIFLIPKFCLALNAVCFFSGRFTGACSLNVNVSKHSVPSSYGGGMKYLPVYEDGQAVFRNVGL